MKNNKIERKLLMNAIYLDIYVILGNFLQCWLLFLIIIWCLIRFVILLTLFYFPKNNIYILNRRQRAWDYNIIEERLVSNTLFIEITTEEANLRKSERHNIDRSHRTCTMVENCLKQIFLELKILILQWCIFHYKKATIINEQHRNNQQS